MKEVNLDRSQVDDSNYMILKKKGKTKDQVGHD